MKPHPRIRKAVKWGGAAATVLLVVVWIGSGCGFLEYRTASGRVWGILAGGITVERHSAPGGAPLPAQWMSGRTPYHMGWNGGVSENPPWWWGLFVPLWPFAVVSAICTAAAWRLDTLARRRARLNLCPKCSYDRTGLAPGAFCPECGSAPP